MWSARNRWKVACTNSSATLGWIIGAFVCMIAHLCKTGCAVTHRNDVQGRPVGLLLTCSRTSPVPSHPSVTQGSWDKSMEVNKGRRRPHWEETQGMLSPSVCGVYLDSSQSLDCYFSTWSFFGSSRRAGGSDPAGSFQLRGPAGTGRVWGAAGLQTRDAVRSSALHSSPLKYQLQNVNSTFLREHN